MKDLSVSGVITFTDEQGRKQEVQFSTDYENGWSQWGAGTAVLGQTVALCEGIASAVYDEGGE